ncbi:hypothetical protein CDAR_496241 [Caerostris darwini]|uniref:C2H2-type domain-containing protein n=1 Tax=Caerostris darwini TaxID=1538125 RepID=A0AAV4WFP0_9ARAC|nr:hypothetical protein CDAR_496241 [Caerostris darwini]
MAQHSNAFSQIECSLISNTNELPPHFSSAYHNSGESGHILTNEATEYSETSLEMSILENQNANYNPMSSTYQNSGIQQTQQLGSFASLSCDNPLERPSCYMDTLCANKEENTLNRTETENPKYFTSHFSLPCTSQNSVTSREHRVNNPGKVKFKEDDYNPKNKQWTDFSYGIAESISYPSSANQICQHNFGGGIKNKSRAWEFSNSVTSSSENKNACKISNTIGASEVNANSKKNSEDKIFDRKASTLKKKMDGPPKTKPFYKCGKCPMTFSRKYFLESHERCHNVEKQYVCNFCDKAFTRNDTLAIHIRSHTGKKPYVCSF